MGSKLSAMFLVFSCLAISAAAQDVPRFEITGTYAYVHTNNPPGKCGCFPMNGGDGSIFYHLRGTLGVVADFGSFHAGDVNSTGSNLNLTSYLFGPQVRVPAGRRMAPFGHVLFGGTHASGLGYGTGDDPANGFAFAPGGGLDLSLNRVVSIRVVEADYYFTHLQNGVNSRENNLRILTGIVLRLGHAR